MAFLKQTPNRRFQYTPRYWNPDEEARQAREKRIRAELGLTEQGENTEEERLRENFRNEYRRHAANRKKGLLTRPTRLFLILVILLLLFFFLLSYKLEAFFNFLGGLPS